jgi:NTP pyrophosphatase (non-canonical NTP hydrolase)
MQDSDNSMTVEGLKLKVDKFIKDRQWDMFHTPRNLAESICIESAELLELFQWSPSNNASCTEHESAELNQIKEELADIIIYCLSMANSLKIDVTDAVSNKLIKNAEKYPIEKYSGKDFLKKFQSKTKCTKQ